MAAETQTGRRHFHLDHLGTPRLITRASGYPAGYHVYYPFGEEATTFNQDAERMKFTGHERDLASPTGAGDDLDYMHARHCSPVTGRFLSVDPALESVEPQAPQTWNRYNYVAGNPLKYVDPTGEILFFFGTANDISNLEQVANQTLHGVNLVIDQSGRASLVPNNETGPASPEQQAFANTLAGAINRPQSVNIGIAGVDSGIVFGQYTSGIIDIRDIAAAGNGRGSNSAAILSHEIAEQTNKQVMGLPNDGAGFNQAHQMAIVAQQAASGYSFVSQTNNLNRRLTGSIVGTHRKGNDTVTVTFRFVNGNLVRTTRRP